MTNCNVHHRVLRSNKLTNEDRIRQLEREVVALRTELKTQRMQFGVVIGTFNKRLKSMELLNTQDTHNGNVVPQKKGAIEKRYDAMIETMIEQEGEERHEEIG